MGTDGILALSLPLALALAAISCAFGLAKAVAAAMESIARQPEAAQKIQGAMIIGCGFIEALTIYALVVVLLFGLGILKVH
ncbi:MAG: ATP synthase F0 subunit C [Candidatus Omnitrophica bacterium]|nr:ATP synthase F0 subunit C [Candidatus Omnitrophota bacterium]MBI2174044.1 ATP synthase F0 subunit C [Candidatus Omnitrophota bacterium]MBI3009871.1 ATP synthase F0 subunit C [Candidatus Omnitrophota bacterium]